ncbi:MAG: hypothetical protein JO323_25165 [Acidobacteriia bacterium]|nr:hypothetical protein [Terriglobia bacterium]
MLEKHQQGKNIGITGLWQPGHVLFLFAELLQTFLHKRIQLLRHCIYGSRLVIKTCLERTISSYQGVERVPNIVITYPRCSRGGLEPHCGQKGNQLTVLLDELLGYPDIPIG